MMEVLCESYHPKPPPECFSQGRLAIRRSVDLGGLTRAVKAREMVFGRELWVSTDPIQKKPHQLLL